MNVLFRLFALSALAGVLHSCTYHSYSMRHYARAQKEGPYDVIIVPGTPYGEQSALAPVFVARMLWSKKLIDEGIAKHVIYSGNAVYTPYYEGKAMKIIADSMGIDPSKTFAEVRANHSTENVYNSMQLARKMGFQKIALATDPFQTQMVSGFMRKHCKGVKKIPVVFKAIGARSQTLPPIDADDARAEAGWVPLTERENFWQRFAGTRGKQINFETDETSEDNLRENGLSPLN